MLFRVLIAALAFSAEAAAEEPCDNGISILDQKIEPFGKVLSFENAPECQMSVGATKYINIPYNQSPTIAPYTYRLTRTGEKAYEVTFNVGFKRDNENGTYTLDRKMNEEWRDKSSDCLKQASSRVLGPRGERIKFKIYDGTYDARLPVNEIGIRYRGRPNSNSWTEDSNCAVIFHELLHLAGLVDEYTEMEQQKYDCRRVYQQNSIMAQGNDAWSHVFDEWNLRINFCECKTAEACKNVEKYKKDISESNKYERVTECPAGFIKSDYYADKTMSDKDKRGFELGAPMRFRLPNEVSDEMYKKMRPAFSFKRRAVNKGLSLLAPRHFNAILFPGCFAKNVEYYQDAQNAYRGSKKNGGEGCVDLNWISKVKKAK